MDKNKFYSLVIPMYNEEGNAGILIDRISDAMNGYHYELILIDDNSTDKTIQEIKEKKHPNVVLIELKKNYGQSSAMMAGFDYATGDYVITLDGDLQNDPSDIPAMILPSEPFLQKLRISSSKNLQNSIFLTKVVR